MCYAVLTLEMSGTMPITIKEQQLLDLLEECLPYVNFCEGGKFGAEELAGKLKHVLSLAGHVVGKPKQERAKR